MKTKPTMKTKYHSAGGITSTITAAEMIDSVVVYEISLIQPLKTRQY